MDHRSIKLKEMIISYAAMCLGNINAFIFVDKHISIFYLLIPISLDHKTISFYSGKHLTTNELMDQSPMQMAAIGQGMFMW